MDELKNLVIQTLETNGILGQIRAKLRSSVFKVIDQNDPDGQDHGLHWENPMAKQVLETAETQLAAELCRDFMEHYKLDYSLSIFIPESGMKEDPIDRANTADRAGVSPSREEPLLVSLLKQGGGKAPAAQREPAAKPVADALDHVEDLAAPQNRFDKKQPSPQKDDTYDDDFGSDGIEELLPDEKPEEPKDDEFGGSQSMGLDPSVNTLAMEEYDHVEEVVRVDE